MITRWNAMLPANRLLSSVLLASGIVLVFAGLSAALGFTAPGMIASIAVITTLLYAGSVWFATPPTLAIPAGAETVLVFDRELHVAAGPGAGTPLLTRFPPDLRPELEVRCSAALRGESHRFVCDSKDARLVFETAPVASVTGVVVFGTLIVSTGISAPSITGRPVTTVA
jgi:hypothetical protein